MIIFSDLDRSIIYSSKFLEEYKENQNLHCCIEVVKEKETSYISLKTINYIKEIQNIGMFIPTTTRTSEQFRRIDFNKYNIDFEYAITSNGGTILKNNKPMKEWDEKVKDILSNCEAIENMVNDFERYKDTEGIIKFAKAENLFFYIVVDKAIFDINNINEYIENLDTKNWSYYINGRKIYFLPQNITKENAISFIVEKLQNEKYITIGDSTMDEGMLKMAPKSYALKHGTIEIEKLNKNCSITENYGTKGTEEILLSIIEESKVLNI